MIKNIILLNIITFMYFMEQAKIQRTFINFNSLKNLLSPGLTLNYNGLFNLGI